MAHIYVHSHHLNEVFELRNGKGTEVSIVYNPLLGTARITSNGSQRMFIMEEEETLLHKRMILKNEYGVKIGQMGNDKWHASRGHIDIEQERFFYKMQGSELMIYQDNPANPLLRSSITGEKDTATAAGSYQCLLMALCWHLQLPVSREVALSYAV